MRLSRRHREASNLNAPPGGQREVNAILKDLTPFRVTPFRASVRAFRALDPFPCAILQDLTPFRASCKV